MIKSRIVIRTHERSDIIHIMKINRLILNDSDTAQLSFKDQVKSNDYQITILVVEELPWVIIKQNGKVVFNDMMKSIDGLKIFFEERLYTYLQL